MTEKNVFPKIVLDEERVRDLIGHGLSRICLAKGKGGKEQLAAHLGVHVDTVKNAIGGDHTPKLPHVFNALSFDPTALDELLQEFGVRLVPLDHREAENATLPILAAVHKIAEAEADGIVDHQELLEMEPELRTASGAITRLLHRTGIVRG